MTTVSKSRYVAGLQCLKRLYLESHAPDLRDASGANDELLAQAGIEVGALARGRFPGGVHVDGEVAWEEAVAATARLLTDPAVPVIYEGAFEHAGGRIRADILVRVASDAFELVEVKLGSRVRQRHETDLAFQLGVLAGAGVRVVRAWLLLLDREYVHAGGPPDLTRLFMLVDLTEQARALTAEVAGRLPAMLATVAADAVPDVAVGAHCLIPRRCPFHGHCHVDPPAHPVSELPRVTPEQLMELAARGVDDIRRLPLDLPGLTPLQRRAHDVVLSGTPFRDPAIGAALAAIRLPAHFVDFETFAPAVPVYPGTRPFEQVPFQWSDHVLAADGTLTHREFLHDGAGDPRRAFAASLIAATENAGSLVAYSSFESDVLLALAEELPDLGPALRDREERIVDLLPIVRDHCYHPALHGSFSIKAVLPAFVPGLGYADLAIRDGLTASRAHAELVDPVTPADRRAELRAQLLAYCRRDTEAMVALYRVLGAGRVGDAA
jgi:Domain of unknown function(DUF2779)